MIDVDAYRRAGSGALIFETVKMLPMLATLPYLIPHMVTQNVEVRHDRDGRSN